MEVKIKDVVRLLHRKVRETGTAEQDNVVGVAEGFRKVGGKRTGEWCAVVYVKKKKPEKQLEAGEKIPTHVQGVRTDVQEVGEFTPRVLDADLANAAKRIDAEFTVQELTERFRPCPGGYSIGHRDITAGTLGCYVGLGGVPHVLSNNHVLANSNEGAPGDPVYQPGPYDGGITTSNLFGTLKQFVEVNFRTPPPRPPKKNTAIKAWRVWMWPANKLSELVGCTNRLTLRDMGRVQVITQPNPNLVDCALSSVAEQFVDLNIYNIGQVRGIRDPQPGQRVRKSGRTTEYTEGTITGLNAAVTVNYGTGHGNADFTDQMVIEADQGEFSAGGDSGSAIVDADGYLVGLLFAGSPGQTIACKATHVARLLGVTIL